MKKNIGIADKVIRILLAVVFAVLFFTKVVTGVTGIILLVLGLVFLLTALINFCPLYWPIGISTRKKSQVS
jgi:hypothetical protein